MANDQQTIKSFLHGVREQADVIIGEPHVSADVKNVIRDLLQVCANFDELLEHSSGQSADTRMLKKKLDQAKADARASENKIGDVKKTILSLVEEIKSIGAESGHILKRHATPNDPDAASATKITAATRKMVEIIIKSA